LIGNTSIDIVPNRQLGDKLTGVYNKNQQLHG